MYKKELMPEIFGWLKVVVFAVLAAAILNNFVFINATIPSASMEKTIITGDRMLAFRLNYLFSTPNRFDVIVFRFPDNEDILFVKRVIGLPGETIQIINGKVYVNNSSDALNDDFINNHESPLNFNEDSRNNFGPVTVPEGHYFMLGDNRLNSDDSRFWTNKFVSLDKIAGKALFKYYRGFAIIK